MGLPMGLTGFPSPPTGYVFTGKLSSVAVTGDARADLQLTPFASIHGRVLDPEGKPAAGIAVEVSPLGGEVVTDEYGAFALQKLPPRTYTIWAQPKPKRAGEDGKRIVTTYYPSAIESDQAAPIRIDGADLFGYDIRLQTAPAREIRGVVIGTDGKPAARTTVLMFKPPSGLMTQVRGGASRFQQPEVQGDQTGSADDGSFEFPEVVEGDWNIRAMLSVRDTEKHRDKVRAASMELHVSKTDIDDLKLQLVEPFDVEISADWGDVPPRTPTRVLAVLMPVDGSLGGIATRPGAQEHQDVFAGRYLVTPAFMPPAGYYLASAMMDGRDVLGQVVELSGPASIKMMYKTGGGSIRGTVEGGPGATVVAMAEPTASAHFGRSADCNANGQFTIADLAPGEYTLLAYRGTQEVSDPDFQAIVAARGERVKVEAGTVASLDLRVSE